MWFPRRISTAAQWDTEACPPEPSFAAKRGRGRATENGWGPVNFPTFQQRKEEEK